MINELKKIGTFLVTELTTELVRKQKKASGKLLKSFRSDVDGIPEGFELAIFAESYFKYIDEGVNGTKRNNNSRFKYTTKKPPLQPLLEWVQIKSLASGNKEVRTAAFAIQTHIWKNGIKGINIVEGILKEISLTKVPEIGEEAVIKLSKEIDTIIKNNEFNNR